MNRHVNAIAGRLSLRAPQRRSLEILGRITGITPPGKDVDLASVLEIIRSEFSSVTDFEREFPSLCFALATGVGKPRRYVLIPHNMIAVNMTLDGLAGQFTTTRTAHV